MERKKLDANKGPVNKYRGGGGGGGPEQRGGGSSRFQPSQWGGSGYFEPHKGVGHHILSLCTLKYCKVPKPSVSLGA